MLRVLTPSEKLPSCQATSFVGRYVIVDAYQEMFGDSRSGNPTTLVIESHPFCISKMQLEDAAG